MNKSLAHLDSRGRGHRPLLPMGKVTKSHCDTGRGCCVRGALVVILGTHNLPQSSGFDSWYLQAISIYCPKTPNVSFHCGIRLINLIIEIRPCLGWGSSGLLPWIQLLHAVSLSQSTYYLHFTHLKYNSKTQLGTTGVLIQQLLGIEQPLIHRNSKSCQVHVTSSLLTWSSPCPLAAP